MEYISIKDCEPLAKAMNVEFDKDNKTNLYEIQRALIDTTNKVMWVNIQKVAKLLSKSLKTPKSSIYEYVSNCANWVIENKRNEIIKETGRFINIINIYNDLRSENILFNQKQAKLLELIFYHICYENQFKTVNQVLDAHRYAIKNNDNFNEYLNCFVKEIKLNIPLEFLEDKAKELVESYNKTIDILS